LLSAFSRRSLQPPIKIFRDAAKNQPFAGDSRHKKSVAAARGFGTQRGLR
jgi:hypothetical protein